MMLDFYDIFYMVTSWFVLHSCYRLISAFSENREIQKKKIAYILMGYLLLTNIIHFKVESSLLKLGIAVSLISVLGIILNHSRKHILVSVAYSVYIVIVVDIVVVLSSGSTFDSFIQAADNASPLGRLLVILFVYIIGIGVRKFDVVRREVEIPKSYWITVVIFLMISIIFSLILLSFSKYEPKLVLGSILMLIFLNVAVFSIYYHLMLLYDNHPKDSVIEYLNDSYKNQLIAMKTSMDNTRAVRHDINRHLVSINTLIDSENYEKANAYINDIQHEYYDDYIWCKTGNDIIDSLVNFEINRSSISGKNITVKASVVPEQLLIKDYELTVVISNLIRNALQAIKSLEKGKVTIIIDYRIGMLYVKIINDHDGNIIVENGRYVSSKSNPNHHGFGLKNVMKVIEKNDGDLEISHTEDQFIVEALMYVDIC